MNNDTLYLLAAHIGGTKARLGLLRPSSQDDNSVTWIYKNRYSVGGFLDPISLFKQFLKEAQQELRLPSPVRLSKACIAVAGPVENNICKMTNVDIVINGQSLAYKLSIDSIELINDFEAVAYGINHLHQQDFYSLQEGVPQDDKPIAVIGAATGLGKSLLVQVKGRDGSLSYRAYPTEGGHINFAPRSRMEFALMQYIIKNVKDENNQPLSRLCVERVVSGRGIVAIYRFLRDCQAAPEKSFWLQKESNEMKGFIEKGREDVRKQLKATENRYCKTLSTAEANKISELINLWVLEDERCRELLDPASVIASAALKKNDPLCILAMQQFLKIYGAELGNCALQFLPYGGQYMAGGITPQILPLIDDEEKEILTAFGQKGRLSDEIKKIPLYVLKNLEIGLIGAAYYVEHKSASQNSMESMGASNSISCSLLAGDIGGTNTRLRLIQGESKMPIFEKDFRNSLFPDFVSIVREFLHEAATKCELAGNFPLKKACFAVAGPVNKHCNTSNLTNSKWILNGTELETELKIEKVQLINDFEAVGYGVRQLCEPADIELLQPEEFQKKDKSPIRTQSRKGSPIGVIGAGTGLGEALVLGADQENDSVTVCPTEGGHIDFAARSMGEFELLEYIQEKHNLAHVSVERVVSGPGIVAIYQYLRDIKKYNELEDVKKVVDKWENSGSDPAKAPSQKISDAAVAQNRDELCVKTMRMFAEAYGSEVGNFALKLLPYEGIYIAGGIAHKILRDDELRERFLEELNNKGRMKERVIAKIPFYLVKNDKVGLIGAAYYAERYMGN